MQPNVSPAAGAAPAPVPTPKPKTVANLPRAEKPLSELLDLAVAEWQKRPALTLAWTTPAATQQLADDFRAAVRAAGAADDARTPQSQRLAQLDALIDGGKAGKLKYVKKGLALQYDEENDGRPYYGEFGIEKLGSTYTLPYDRGKRAEALLKLVAALPKHGLDKAKYGLKFWQPLADEYNKLQPKAAQAAGTRSAEVGGKDALRDQVEEFLLALLHLLQANYPKTYKAERRQFGFLKESYG